MTNAAGATLAPPMSGMCMANTPVEYHPEFGLWVKREDLSCPGGPNFSKTRGVWAHIQKRPERLIGVLDTVHSQGGWAVARACALLGKQCVLHYPATKDYGLKLRPQQRAAADLEADVLGVRPFKSIVLWYRMRKEVEARGGYAMPNALKLPESIEETALEVGCTNLPPVANVLVSVSSGTLAAGVLRGLALKRWRGTIILHLGYSRSPNAVLQYVQQAAGAGLTGIQLVVVNENYSYKDEARSGIEPPFPSNAWYDLKAWRWWVMTGQRQYGQALLWNIG